MIRLLTRGMTVHVEDSDRCSEKCKHLDTCNRFCSLFDKPLMANAAKKSFSRCKLCIKFTSTTRVNSGAK